MKDNKDKQQSRFSPLAPHNSNSPSLSHPRRASAVALSATSKLFAISGPTDTDIDEQSTYGALSNDVDVSALPENLDFTLSEACKSPPITLLQMPLAEITEVKSEADEEMSNGWDYYAEEEAMLLGSSAQDPTAFSVDPYIKMESDAPEILATPKSNSADLSEPTLIAELTEFEKWVVTRIREAHASGDILVDGLRAMQRSSRAIHQRNLELQSRLDKIKAACTSG
ncbi:hypothetical protein C8R43DRAFT_953220 [Mycena crocata]|nr:hypothetical protein C8R43DRAFT_953220 [Mycena crocata]